MDAFQPSATSVRYSATGRALAQGAPPVDVYAPERNRGLNDVFEAIIADHGGTLVIQSALGVGTTVTVTLPISTS